MIDEYWIFRLYGYHSDDLVSGSGQRVIAPCEECALFRSLQMRNYSDLCRKCVKHAPDTLRKMRASAKTRPPLTISTLRKMSAASTGRECTDEKRAKLRKANGGENHWNYGGHPSEATRAKLRKAQCGENNGNWKGGKTSWRALVYQSSVYKNWRTSVFKRDGYTCQMCNVHGGNLQAHHIHPIRDHKNDLLIFDINNGITLCKKCHESINSREYDYIDLFTIAVSAREGEGLSSMRDGVVITL